MRAVRRDSICGSDGVRPRGGLNQTEPGRYGEDQKKRACDEGDALFRDEVGYYAAAENRNAGGQTVACYRAAGDNNRVLGS